MAKQLTEEMVRNSNVYIALKLKASLAKNLANECIEKIEIPHKDEMLPPIYKENQEKRMLVGMIVLLREYLKVLDKEETRFTDIEYDEWGGSGILNQLNRFKSSKDAEIRDKAYDILDDYREFYRMLGAEINAQVTAKNDLISRIVQYMDGKMTPEYFEQSLKDLRDVQMEAEEYIKQRPKMFEEAVGTDK